MIFFFPGSTTSSSRNGDMSRDHLLSSSSSSRPRGGFDVSSLIGLPDSDRSSARSPTKSVSSSHPSPNMSVGPPAPPAPSPSSLYPFLFHPGFYQHLASGFNPMLLNAQLALAAQHNPLFASAYAHHLNNPNIMAASSAQHLLSPNDRLRQHRFSPYSMPPGSPSSSPLLAAAPPRTSPSSPKSPWTTPASPPRTSPSGSAFHTVLPKKISSPTPPPQSSSPSSDSPPPPKKLLTSSSPPPSLGSPSTNDIKSMENLVNGLNGSTASKFGISHDQREIST